MGLFSAREPCTAVTVRGDRDRGRLVPVVERRGLLQQAHPLHAAIAAPLPWRSYYWTMEQSDMPPTWGSRTPPN